MRTLAVDLHSHSGYAGGVGQISFRNIAQTMHWKGIDVFGTGDCLYPPRTEELKSQLSESALGLFSLPDSNKHFLLQTEVIFTTRIPQYSHKIVAHHIILFPNFHSISQMGKLMDKWKQKKYDWKTVHCNGIATGTGRQIACNTSDKFFTGNHSRACDDT